MEEKQLVGVRFKSVGKIYFFSTTIALQKLDKVVVETARGLEMGEIATELKAIEEFDLDTELKQIIRKATDEDIENYERNVIKAKESLILCKEIIENFKLDMRLVHCEYTLDATKVIFMYISDERVDFRELLKELASIFKCRIELRQIGPRDKAKLIGGLGSCGMPLCCSTFLGEFDGVSINMAKNQMLAINIEKISGSCGRLMCCLKYEDDLYTEIKKDFPKIGNKVTFEDKQFKVTSVNVLNKRIKIENSEQILFITLDELQAKKRIEKNQIEQQVVVPAEKLVEKADSKAKYTKQNNKQQKKQNYQNSNQNKQRNKKNDKKNGKQ